MRDSSQEATLEGEGPGLKDTSGDRLVKAFFSAARDLRETHPQFRGVVSTEEERERDWIEAEEIARSDEKLAELGFPLNYKCPCKLQP